jgi:hypothetical protein
MTIKERSLFKNCGGGWVKWKEGSLQFFKLQLVEGPQASPISARGQVSQRTLLTLV